MFERTTYDKYEDGYAIGWEEGRKIGYDEGFLDAINDFQPRISKYWAELATLNARIDYLEKVLSTEK